MEKIFAWFNERTQREKIILTVFPFLIALLVYFRFILPLTQEENNLKNELKTLRDVAALQLRKNLLSKQLKKLKEETVKFKPVDIKDFYKLAKISNIDILELEKGSKKRFMLSFVGNTVSLRKGQANKRTRGRVISVEPIYMKLVGNSQGFKKYINNLAKENYPIVIYGFYTGCLSDREYMRRKNPPLICETAERTYKGLICEKRFPEKAFLTILKLNVGD